MIEIENHTSYFNRFCIFCYRICPQLLKATGCMAILLSLLFYFEVNQNYKYEVLGFSLVWLSIILCCVTTLITIFALCALWRGSIKHEIDIVRTEEAEASIEPVTKRSFCYKWCSRLLIATGACCVCLTPLCILELLLLIIWPIQHSFDEAPLGLVCVLLVWSLYYFCLFASIPVLFTAILKLLDRH